MNTYNIQTVDFTGDTFTELLGINNEGTIVGLHGTANQGFSLTLPATFPPENPPGAAMTDVVGINNQGVSTGFFVDANGTTHGFVHSGGLYTTVDLPGATAPGQPIASLTLAGFSTSDLKSGRLSVSFGTDAACGSAYMSIHANS
ncbi:MAG TPA: hypothetical protein DDZ81_20130 [Acetobacteraceae bacterium]|jgi:hypothetical protein|nr:hypothetical protein [Acetobacteraceae bacterium]